METQNKKKNNITEGPIAKQLLLFFFPILIGTFFQQLYNTVDAVVVGRFAGKEALAAVGASAQIVYLLVNFFVSLASGATVILSQFYGAKDQTNVSKTVHTAAVFSLCGGVVLMILGFFTVDPILRIMKVPAEVLPDAKAYLNVYYAGIIFSLVYNIGTGLLRAIGDSRTPLYILIVCCLTNVVLDMLFVAAFRWGAFGVALATAISQAASAVLIVWKLRATRDSYRLEWKELRMDFSILRRIISIGLPAGMQAIMYSVSNMIIQTSINAFGTNPMAAWTAVGKIDGFVWMVMGAFGISVTTFVGQNFGAGKYDRLKKGVRACLWMTLGAIAVLSVLMLVLPGPLLGFFIDDPTVIGMGTAFLRLLAPWYTVYVFTEIYARSITGAGEAIRPMIITLTGTCFLRVFWVLVIAPLRPSIIWMLWAYPITWAVTSLAFAVYYLRMKWLSRCISTRAGAIAEADK